MGRRPAQREAPDRLEQLGERAPGGVGEVAGGELEAAVGVDAPPAGWGERSATVERQPGGVREQVAECRALRPDGVIEGDNATLDRGEHHHGGRELGDRGPRERALEVSRAATTPSDATMATAAWRQGQLSTCLKGSTTSTLQRWIASASRPGPPSRSGWGTRGLFVSAARCGSRAPPRSCPATPIPDQSLRAGAALLHDHRGGTGRGGRSSRRRRPQPHLPHRSGTHRRDRPCPPGGARHCATGLHRGRHRAARSPLARRDRDRRGDRGLAAERAAGSRGAPAHRSSVVDHRFGSSRPFTLGVEEELMLIDPIGFDLVPRIAPLLASAAGGELERWVKSELMQSVVEIATPVCASAAEIGDELVRLRGGAAGLAAGARVRDRLSGHPSVRVLRGAGDHRRSALRGDDRGVPAGGPPAADLRPAHPYRRSTIRRRRSRSSTACCCISVRSWRSRRARRSGAGRRPGCAAAAR